MLYVAGLPAFLVVPLTFRVPVGPAAREIATRELAARSGRSRGPPWPSGPTGILHTGGACSAADARSGRCVCWWAAARLLAVRAVSLRLGVVDLEARPGPAAAHQHCVQALPPRVSHRAVGTLLWF